MFIRSSSLIINYGSIMFILPRHAINYFPTINYPQHSSTINYHSRVEVAKIILTDLSSLSVLSNALVRYYV